jgi:hypothetical protein
MSHKQYNLGGQRRTTDFPCGFRIQGHPNELGLKTRLHKKTCDRCKDVNIEQVPFNKAVGTTNGWSGVTKENKVIKQEDKMATITHAEGGSSVVKYSDIDAMAEWINK